MTIRLRGSLKSFFLPYQSGKIILFISVPKLRENKIAERKKQKSNAKGNKQSCNLGASFNKDKKKP